VKGKDLHSRGFNSKIEMRQYVEGIGKDKEMSTSKCLIFTIEVEIQLSFLLD
jgi:hypothetical protein